MNQNNWLSLKCFSPSVMAATFIIETSIALYVLCRYRMTDRSRAIVAILICLAGFQLAEFYVCTGSQYAMAASRAGYVAITFLPPLGLYLMGLLTKKVAKFWMSLCWAAAFMFIGYFSLADNAFRGYECTGNYVIFQIGRAQAIIYGTYYFGLIAAAVIRAIRFTETKKAKNTRAAQWLLAGYAFFITPVAILTVIQPRVTQAIPSVLCGFAVTLAIVLGYKVAPLSLKKR